MFRPPLSILVCRVFMKFFQVQIDTILDNRFSPNTSDIDIQNADQSNLLHAAVLLLQEPPTWQLCRLHLHFGMSHYSFPPLPFSLFSFAGRLSQIMLVRWGSCACDWADLSVYFHSFALFTIWYLISFSRIDQIMYTFILTAGAFHLHEVVNDTGEFWMTWDIFFIEQHLYNETCDNEQISLKSFQKPRSVAIFTDLLTFTITLVIFSVLIIICSILLIIAICSVS